MYGRNQEIDEECNGFIWRDRRIPKGASHWIPINYGLSGFDIKIGEGFSRRARYCADSYKTDPPAYVTYINFVSIESVWIILLISALKYLEVQGTDIHNLYLNEYNRSEVWLRDGPEFG